MKPYPLQKRGISASQLVLGCMRLGGGWDQSPLTAEHYKQGHEAVDAALEIGINMFDHADIYAAGKAERVFSQVLKERPGLREQVLIQSKCGIRFQEGPDHPHRFDFSEAHILRSVDGILERLGTEYIDFLLLHRPDPLVDPEEVASAVHRLKASGKVRWFGVSNMGQGQIKLLQAYCDEPFIVNQLELSLLKNGFIEQGIHINQDAARDSIFPEGTLEYCRLENIQLQSWGPLAQGVFSGGSLEGRDENTVNTAKLVHEMAKQKDTTPEAIVLAWLTTHPSGIQPVIGTVNPERIRACKDAATLRLTREEWYKLYTSQRGRNMP
ncbi:aldo/keto reductase [Paenibacillus spongiae]|uniref:Aldo/keto reductase n=1 Tax=Paenibacillus spongiae TaxID=2909671 RepID=A0ABY5S8P4_9BACL|nr:aldo/keto reductase [Paenibacillus spongiae]UVI28905.1 aldo/keto reductase [Paenibacillus spongiae]